MRTALDRWRARRPGWVRRALKDKETWKSASLALLALSAVVSLVFVVPTVYRTKAEAAAGRRAAEEVRRGNEAATCRGAFAGAVTDARAGLDDATAGLDDARADLDVALSAQQQAFVDLGVAAVAQDPAAYTAARSSIDDATRLVSAVQVRVADGRISVSNARAELVDANSTYQGLLNAAPTDFRSMCRTGPPG